MKPFYSKRAMNTFSLIVTLVIVLASLFTIFLLLKKIGDVADDSAERTRCRNSVMAYAKLNRLPFGDQVADAADIDCPTQFVTIEKDTPVVMRREVANMMYDCWNNYGEGKLQLFSATSQKFCGICSVFQFEDKSVQLDGLSSFLMTEKIPGKNRAGVSPSYYDYIAGSSGVQTDPDVVDKAKQADTNFLDGSQRYVILFTYYKQSYWSKVKGFLVGAGIGAATVLVAGAITVISGGTLAVVAAGVVKVGFTTAMVVGGAVGAAASGGNLATHGADWDSRLVMVVYNTDALKELGCEELPISMVDKQFR